MRATGSGVVAVFAVTREETVICIEQFRPAIVPIEQYRIARPLHALGLIAGLCDVQGEEASDAAVRELREEAGCVADQWVEVPMQAECAGVTDGIVRVWLALNARRVLQPRLDGSEVALGLRQIELPLAELPQALLQYHRETGNVVDPKLMACRGWYEHFTGRRF
ncbi:MAG: NUDIX hydrolase [bacterium]|nr:NUDIX hydrolase [bacterium]